MSVQAEIEEKTERLVAMLGQEDLGGVLLNGQHNFAWLTGGASNGIDLSRENGIATLFVTSAGKRYVLANNIEMPRLLAEQISAEHFEPVEFSWQDEKADSGLVFDTARSLVDGGIGTDLPIDRRTCTIEGAVSRCRFRLTHDELERIRRQGADAGAAMDSAVATIAPGMTELTIAEVLRSALATRDLTSVVTLVAVDERVKKYRHPVPTANTWAKVALLVTCAKRDGLIVSLSRIVCVGPVPSELAETTEAAAFVNAKLLNATRPGVTGADLYQIAAEAYSRKGYTDEINKHHQGGAAGYRTREWVAHPKSNETVRPDQAFAWNPSITGTKIEETCIAGDIGIEIVTHTKDQPSIITMIDGREYHSPDIISI